MKNNDIDMKSIIDEIIERKISKNRYMVDTEEILVLCQELIKENKLIKQAYKELKDNLQEDIKGYKQERKILLNSIQDIQKEIKD